MDSSRNWRALKYLDLAESRRNWSKRYRYIVMNPESVCTLCERGIEDFKYSSIKGEDMIKVLEDLAEELYKWKKPCEFYVKEREYGEGYDSLADQRRCAMKYHGLDVEVKQ